MNRKKIITAAMAVLIGMPAMADEKNSHAQNFPLESIQLLDGKFKHACDLNIAVLLKYDTDRLLSPFLKTAGLTPKGESFENWIGLDGHVGGHYLSALALAYSATGNEECKRRMDYMVDELKKAQDKNGDGYVGGVPYAVWHSLEKGDIKTFGKAWVPWYNVHKVFAGLHDAYVYGHNEKAKAMFISLCDWGISITSRLDDTQMEKMLDIEFGGMNESFADAYKLTGEKKYLDASKRFSHKMLFDSMKQQKDNLDNKHANTQVPKAVGYQRVAELTGDADFATAARFFWQTVVSNRSLAFGGNSRREHFPTAKACTEYTEDREGPESCNTYNMLKLTEGLFRMNPDAVYADFYERAMFNHILSTQNPEHGGYVYFTPARPRHYRVYSQPNQAMWCCVGTGMENHSKYGEFIYAYSNENKKADDKLYVNLFVASRLNWKEHNLQLTQETSFPYSESTRFTMNMKKPSKFTLMLRHPGWIAKGDYKVTVNGSPIDVSASVPSSYLPVSRKWKNGDVVEISLPKKITVEAMPNVPDFVAVMCGPILLGAETGTENLNGLLADEGRWAHIAHGPLEPISSAPHFIGTIGEIKKKLAAMHPADGQPMHFTCPELFSQKEFSGLVFKPFAEIHDCRYMIYWPTMTEEEYNTVIAEQQRQEAEMLQLDKLTTDKVKPGEQQPEVDHAMLSENSRKSYWKDRSVRDASKGGYFSYNLITGGETSLTLRVTYWGDEPAGRSFGIYVDDKLLANENLSGKWNRKAFVDECYDIPAEMLKGKSSIRIKFQSGPNTTAGGVYFVRLVRKQ